MTDASWEALSDQAVTACGIVYFLALLATLIEWSALRKVPLEGSRSVGATAAGATKGTASGATQGAGGEGGSDTLTETRPSANDPEESLSGRIEMFGRLGMLLTLLAAAVHLVGLVARGMAADPNRVPWGNMYEFTLTGTWVVVAIYLATYRKFGLRWLSPVVLFFALTILMADMIWLHERVSPLSEALSSYWLVIHVVSAIIATGAFTVGGMTSLLYLVKKRWGGSDRGYLARLPQLRDLDRISYRMHAFGFPVWTFAVLITGPIWAHQAWSSYWNWDPKEVWAFITWVVYAAYLHARSTAGWKGSRAAVVALIGLATLWFNFIGINFITSLGGNSQHSYASAPAIPEPGTGGATELVADPPASASR